MQNRLLSAMACGALVGFILLGVEGLANLAAGQPPLAGADLFRLLPIYVVLLVPFGLVLALHSDAGARLMGLAAAAGFLFLGAKATDVLEKRGLEWPGALVGFLAAALLAGVGFYVLLRLTRRRLEIRWILGLWGILLVPTAVALNVNAFGSPLERKALTADGLAVVLSLGVAGVAGFVLRSWRHPWRTLLALAVGCWGIWLPLRWLRSPDPPGPAPAAPKTDIVLVVVDALRADHMGLYGYARPTTPELDAWSEEGIVYTHVVSSASWTLPSFASLFTGVYPHRHGAGRNAGAHNTHSSLDPTVPTLAERLGDAGYRTGALVTNPYLKRAFALDRGFDTYEDALGLDPLPNVHPVLQQLHIPLLRDRYYRQADRMVDRAIRWWEDTAGGPRYLLLHIMDPHEPYLPPLRDREAIGIGDSRVPVDLYDAEIRFTDRELGRLFRHVRGAVVLFTADHGEEFGERPDVYPGDPRPFTRHGHTLYEELLSVPLVVVGAGGEGTRSDRLVRSIDVVPTVLELAGAEPIQGDGTPLWEVLGRPPAGEGSPPGAQALLYGTEKRSVRVGDWKLIHTAWGDELYDLATDPHERTNRAGERPDLVEALRADLPEAGAGDGRAADLDPATRRQLEALGYVGHEP